MSLGFDGQVAIVTGAGGTPGLGHSYARLLARLGARVVVNDLGVGPDGRGTAAADAERVAKEIRAAGGDAVADTGSVSTEEGAHAIVRTALDRWGRVDVLVNNAGVLRFGLLGDLSPVDIRAMVDVHLFGAIWMCRAVWPHMRESGYGRIVNTTSPGMLGSGYGSIYGAVKSGIYGLTRSLAIEGAPHGIRVNALAPLAATVAWQVVETPGGSEQPIGGAADALHPDTIAPVAAFLAHAECPFSGKNIVAEPGHVSEIHYSQTEGYHAAGVTLDDLYANWRSAVSRRGSEAVPDPDKTNLWVGGTPPVRTGQPQESP